MTSFNRCTFPRMSYHDIPFRTGSVTSQDGTAIGYRRFGEGPPVVLVHGSLSAGQHMMALGKALSGEFTVYIPDRRGRGHSGPAGSAYSLEKEIDDLIALLVRSRAKLIFGAGTGALIVLETLPFYSAVRKAVLYEPMLDVDGELLRTLAPVMRRYERELAQGKTAEALTTIMKGTGLLPDTIYSKRPHFVLARSFRQALEEERQALHASEIALETLIPLQRNDYKLMVESKGTLEEMRELAADVLLLGGSHSHHLMKRTLEVLEQTLPHVRRSKLKGMGHAGPSAGDEEAGQLAAELKKFFAAKAEG